MASITKRGKSWAYSVSRYTDGKYDPIRKSGFKTKKEAQVAALEVEMRLQKGANILTRNKPFVEYFEFWIDKYKKDKHKNTYRNYKYSLSRAKEYFKDKPIQKISADEYQTFLDDYAATRSKESVRKINSHIRACVRDAIDEGYIAIDFTRKAVIKGSVPAKKESEKYINYEDSKKLYYYLLNNLNNNSARYLILFGLVTGLRFGELVGLTEQACDFEKNQIYVHQAWDYRDGSGFVDLKNTYSERTIQVDPVVMDVLKKFIEDNYEENDEYGLIFKGDGKIKVVSNDEANDELRLILKELKINDISCHGLRHTHASVLLFEGFSLLYVSERLGHESTHTTQKTYSHVLKEMRANEEDKLKNLYKEKKKENT